MSDDSKKVELSGKLKLVNSADYKFAPENYKVTWWDRVKNFIFTFTNKWLS